MPPKKNAGAAKTSKGKSSEESGKTEKKGGNAVKVRKHFVSISNICIPYNYIVNY